VSKNTREIPGPKAAAEQHQAGVRPSRTARAKSRRGQRARRRPRAASDDHTPTSVPQVEADALPKTSISNMYRALLGDSGELRRAVNADRSGSFRAVLLKSLFRASEDPRLSLQIAEAVADRLEGKPTQTLHVKERRTTIFSGPKEAPPSDEPRSVVPGAEPAASAISPATMWAVDLPEPPRNARA
jgi:hypothetical protein